MLDFLANWWPSLILSAIAAMALLSFIFIRAISEKGGLESLPIVIVRLVAVMLLFPIAGVVFVGGFCGFIISLDRQGSPATVTDAPVRAE